MPSGDHGIPHPSLKGALYLHGGRALFWHRYEGTIRICDLDTAEKLSVICAHTDEIHGAMLLHGGRVLSWADAELRLTLLEQGPVGASEDVRNDESWVLSGHAGRVQGALQLRDGAVLSWAEDGSLRLWDLDFGTTRREFNADCGGIVGATPFGGSTRSSPGPRTGRSACGTCRTGRSWPR